MLSGNDTNFHKFDLKEKWGLITGGAGLLGVEHARALLQAGANVVLWDIDSEKLEAVKLSLERDFPIQEIKGMCVDITLEEAVINAQIQLEKQNIHISILINNAAINPKYELTEGNKNFSRVENLRIDDWEFQLRVGLTGTFICSKVFGTLMAERNYGVIVNIASDLSVISPDQRLYKKIGLSPNDQQVKPITYSVIKSGLIGLTKYLATYWCESGVRVNAIRPGFFPTEWNRKNFITPERDAAILNHTPMGRFGETNELIGAAIYLASAASNFVTGSELIVDGGFSAMTI